MFSTLVRTQRSYELATGRTRARLSDRRVVKGDPSVVSSYPIRSLAYMIEGSINPTVRDSDRGQRVTPITGYFSKYFFPTI
jgi:hypothetical protein